MTKKDIPSGERFGRWVVVERNADGNYTTKCDCGTMKSGIESQSLKRGMSTSCGCFRREATGKRFLRGAPDAVGFKKLTLENEQEILAARLNAVRGTQVALAAKFGVTKQLICQMWRKANLEMVREAAKQQEAA